VLTGSVHDADDLLQTTVERLLRKGIPDNVDTEKWAYRICRNLFIDEYRSTRRRMANEQASQPADAVSMDTQQIVIDQTRLQRVTSAMDTLPEDQRAALALVVLNGFSYAQVAEALEVPIGTVMSRIARARKSLAEQLHEDLQ
jgi:RNA polymerase sigma-70 factor (ECF subfamily)